MAVNGASRHDDLGERTYGFVDATSDWTERREKAKELVRILWIPFVVRERVWA